ncbi:glucose-methanol-choline oxidoreductase [Whalleya microplaca]|nr:glucose-methanol-choline oxidoreductase [Whalleya microplaca]
MKPLYLLPAFAPLIESQWAESISAQGLIGSHFGVAGVSASYDYLVLGGGTAGLTMARRLAEDTRRTVAVVEAGDFYEFINGNNSAIPAMASTFLGSQPSQKNPFLDWYQWTEAQLGLSGRSVVYSQGKVLGGSSARNLMFYTRAPKGALQEWADLTADDSYLFDNFISFYKKSTRFTPPNSLRSLNSTPVYDESLWNPDGGPVKVGYSNWVNPMSSWIERALETIGLKSLPGFADGNILGYAYTSLALDSETQTRSSSETSFLREALAETNNMNVYKNTMAKRVLFNDKRAIGAVVESGGVEYQLNATQEVIICAGTFRSPQLLMVSGIGPRNTLEKLDIEVISDLQGVGQNMWDHVSLTPSYVVNVVTHSALSNPRFLFEQTKEYLENRTGMLTNLGAEILAFAKFHNCSITQSTQGDLDKFPSDWPDYEYAFRDSYFGFGRDRSDFPVDGRNYASPTTAIMKPFSRGNVTIISNNTNDYPIVNPNWLSDLRDQEMAIEAFKRARDIFSHPVLRDVVLGDEVFPGLNVSTDAEILASIQQIASTFNHASSTCAMGRRDNPMAVVDSNGRVYGVERLRVVDASIFPVLPPCHPMATVCKKPPFSLS